MNSKIKVLIVDDSVLFREVLARGLSKDPQIEVVAKASDPFQARDEIIKHNPNVMTCDIEMPRMNGIEFIRRLIPQYPLPVIVVSTISDAIFDAMNAGAVDFVTKPDDKAPGNIEAFIIDLAAKIKVAVTAKIKPSQILHREETNRAHNFDNNKIIAIGASTGGTEALYNVLKRLPSNIPGIVIVQHIPPVFSRMFADRMNVQTSLNVKEAEGNEFIEPGRAYIAPGDKHLRIRKIGNRYKTEIFEGDKVNGHCPSVDVLFDSVAKECSQNAVGVILTGMGQDGAKGLLKIRNCGSATIGQDEKTAVVYGMPKVAYEIGAVERQCGIEAIPTAIINAVSVS
ncbi:MAG: chemotaxis response regulator protein-glutamate methylesterase [Clostridiales bacterium GWF2_38_85]|nr:MAG: chemotaxis response regulator protein-glutamate methylesterase [Clostridiales bacterium GWF2_38_85]HBL83446.1 chemotaxis response regulator protein-glutamate methylesterase [Clostridiales bacterium]